MQKKVNLESFVTPRGFDLNRVIVEVLDVFVGWLAEIEKTAVVRG